MKVFSSDIGRLYKIGRLLRKYKLSMIAEILDKFNNIIHNSFLSSETKIGEGTIFAYNGIGLVIHKDSVIGENCMIGQGITIGGIGGPDRRKLPIIENNVYIGAGARILGNIRIGHDTIIAPNTVIIRSIEPYSVVGGIPSKIIARIDKKGFDEKYKYYYGISNYLETENITNSLEGD